ncbi:MAG: phage tail tube protein [Celeribacter sp.]|jgi:predicted secreted protein
MAALAGRDLRIKYDSGAGAVAIAGARSDNLTVNKGMIDITDKDDEGIRTLLDDIATKSLTGSVTGVLKDATLIDLVDGTEATHLPDMEIEVVGIGTWSGKFFISSLETAGEEGENPVTFTANLESSGAITWTADT